MKLLTALFLTLVFAAVSSAQDVKLHILSVRQHGNVTTIVAESATVRYEASCKVDPRNAFTFAESCQPVEAGKDYAAARLPAKLRSPGFNCLLFISGTDPKTGLHTFYPGLHYDVTSEEEIRRSGER
jgi:hypothetical protein